MNTYGVSFAEAIADAGVVNLEGLWVPFLSKANLIKNKLATGREKDRLDARTLMDSASEDKG